MRDRAPRNKIGLFEVPCGDDNKRLSRPPPVCLLSFHWSKSVAATLSMKTGIAFSMTMPEAAEIRVVGWLTKFASTRPANFGFEGSA